MNGYLYIAYGDEHVNEAINSFQSLRRVDSNADVTIISDRKVPDFNRCIVKDFPSGLEGKVKYLTNEYYDQTLYIDTDTYFGEDCSQGFNLLNYFDLCMMPDPAEPELSIGISSYNTGVVFLKRNKKVSDFLVLFKKYYADPSMIEQLLTNHPAKKQKTDQPFFSLAIRDSDIKIYPLPPIWNVRYRFNTHLMGKVKIIHGPPTDFEKLKKEMDTFRGNRCWLGKR